MRLRQAHAILEAATALEAAGLGIELFPHGDEPGSLFVEDRMSGAAWLHDSDGSEHVYNIDLAPGGDGQTVIGLVSYSLDLDAPALWRGEYGITADPKADPPQFRGLIGAKIADQIANVIRAHERARRATQEDQR